jgi:hypothetical protein
MRVLILCLLFALQARCQVNVEIIAETDSVFTYDIHYHVVNDSVRIDSLTLTYITPQDHIISLPLNKWYMILIIKDDRAKEMFIETGTKKQRKPLKFIPDFTSSKSILVSWDPDVEKYKYLLADIEP